MLGRPAARRREIELARPAPQNPPGSAPEPQGRSRFQAIKRGFEELPQQIPVPTGVDEFTPDRSGKALCRGQPKERHAVRIDMLPKSSWLGGTDPHSRAFPQSGRIAQLANRARLAVIHGREVPIGSFAVYSRIPPPIEIMRTMIVWGVAGLYLMVAALRLFS